MEQKAMRDDASEMSEGKLLETIRYIISESEEDHLDSEELERLMLAWKTIKEIHQAKWYAKQSN